MARPKARPKRKKRQLRSQSRRPTDGHVGQRRRVGLLIGSGLLIVVAVVLGIVFTILPSSGSDGNAGEPLTPQPATGRVGTKVGDQIPDVGMRLVDGSRVNVATLVSTRKPVFLFFFATW